MTDVTVIRFILNLLMFSMWFLFYGQLLERRFSRRMTLLTTAGIILILNVIGLLWELPDGWNILRTITGFGFLSFYIIFFYKGPLYWKVLLFVGQNIATVICEIAMLAIVLSLEQTATIQTLTVAEFILTFSIDFLLQAVLLGVIALLVKRHTNRLDLSGMQRFSIYPLAQFILFGAMVWILVPGNDTGIIVGMVVFLTVALLADVALLSALREIGKKETIAIQNKFLTEQCRLQMQHYTALQEQYANIRKLRHDIVGHLHTIQILTERGEGEKAQAYADDVLHEYGRISTDTDFQNRNE